MVHRPLDRQGRIEHRVQANFQLQYGAQSRESVNRSGAVQPFADTDHPVNRRSRKNEQRSYQQKEEFSTNKEDKEEQDQLAYITSSLEQYIRAADELKDDIPSIEDILKGDLQRKCGNSSSRQGVLCVNYNIKVVGRTERAQKRTLHTRRGDELGPISHFKIQRTNSRMGNVLGSVRTLSALLTDRRLLDALQGDANESVKQFEIPQRTAGRGPLERQIRQHSGVDRPNCAATSRDPRPERSSRGSGKARRAACVSHDAAPSERRKCRQHFFTKAALG
ncbi:hypothetical protein GCK32_002673 [Trichostrongylus colubriformis]|uniref:Uncharacterized protein n=1 Tax=Trichostrongylus colubriformis TaxID=6319 RepID=A0AAN8IP32_TRICO